MGECSGERETTFKVILNALHLQAIILATQHFPLFLTAMYGLAVVVFVAFCHD